MQVHWLCHFGALFNALLQRNYAAISFGATAHVVLAARRSRVWTAVVRSVVELAASVVVAAHLTIRAVDEAARDRPSLRKSCVRSADSS